MNQNIEKDQPVGIIQKTWAGLFKELFTQCDNYFIIFPPQATAEHRAVLASCLVLIDYLYFEQRNRRNNRMMY